MKFSNLKKRNNRLPFSPDVDKEKKKEATDCYSSNKTQRKKDSWICMEKTTNN